MASVPAPALTMLAVQSGRLAVMAMPVIMSASSLLVADIEDASNVVHCIHIHNNEMHA